jgi:hypothetical protein
MSRCTLYHEFRIERVDPAGLTISYVPNGGGLGMEKVPFNLFPDDWQRRYGYDPEKAAKFDLEQKRAMVQLRQQMIADEKGRGSGSDSNHQFTGNDRYEPAGATITARRVLTNSRKEFLQGSLPFFFGALSGDKSTPAVTSSGAPASRATHSDNPLRRRRWLCLAGRICCGG